MLLSAASNDVGVNVRLVGYGLPVSIYQGIYNRCDVGDFQESVEIASDADIRSPID